jgi:hypothetical protein
MALIVQVSSRNTIIVFSTSTIQYLSCNEVLVLLVFMMSQVVGTQALKFKLCNHQVILRNKLC